MDDKIIIDSIKNLVEILDFMPDNFIIRLIFSDGEEEDGGKESIPTGGGIHKACP